jgi:hypothetical protein
VLPLGMLGAGEAVTIHLEAYGTALSGCFNRKQIYHRGMLSKP